MAEPIRFGPRQRSKPLKPAQVVALLRRCERAVLEAGKRIEEIAADVRASSLEDVMSRVSEGVAIDVRLPASRDEG